MARRLVIASAALLGYWVAAAVVAIAFDWPAEFGTSADDDPTTLWEWIWRGSLIHAPLPPILVQVGFTLLGFLRRRGWHVTAGIGLAGVGVVYGIGFLGEPALHPERSDPPVVAYVLIRAVGVAGVLAVIGFGVATVVDAVRRS